MVNSLRRHADMWSGHRSHGIYRNKNQNRKVMKKVFTTAFIAMLSLSAFAQTKADTLVVTTTPEMHCEGCENKIKKNIRFVKGTKKIETSVPNQTVTIVYDGRKTTYADYESAFKKIGYSVKKVKK